MTIREYLQRIIWKKNKPTQPLVSEQEIITYAKQLKKELEYVRQGILITIPLLTSKEWESVKYSIELALNTLKESTLFFPPEQKPSSLENKK